MMGQDLAGGLAQDVSASVLFRFGGSGRVGVGVCYFYGHVISKDGQRGI